MSEEECLLEEVSPNGNVQAYVGQDDRVVYFYLRGEQEGNFGVKACWVRNVQAAPKSIDNSGMEQGLPPMLPVAYCGHPAGQARLESSRLRVLWLEEGDAAALLEDDDILAIIPAWSGQGDFAGYARDCVAESNLCWPLTADNQMIDRVGQAADYWASWDENVWGNVKDAQCASYDDQIGKYESYYAIDGDNWPPKGLVRIELDDSVVLATVGVCMRAQPGVDQYVETGEAPRRIEIAMAMSIELDAAHCLSVAEYISGQSIIPWSDFTFLGPYHTIPCDVFGDASGFSAVLLLPAAPQFPDLCLHTFRGDPVSVLWMVAITAAEHQFAIAEGSHALAERLAAAGHGVICQERSSVI